MKISFDKENLLEALIPASSVSPNKNTNFILECVLFNYPSDENGKCRLTAYDMEKGMRTFIDCECDEDNVRFAVNAQNILQIVRCMPDGMLTIEIENNSRAKISSGNVAFEIGAASGETFPALPLLAGDRNYTIPQYIFRKIVNMTLFATAQNEQGKAFSGVLFNVEAGNLTCVGCDRNMIAVADFPLDNNDVPDHSIIVPGKILTDILRSVKDSEDEMTISVARKHIIFRIGDYIYFSRIIDEEYLNYRKIISLSGDCNVYADAESFRDAVERATIVTEDKLGGRSKSSLLLNYTPDKIEISSTSANGSIHDEIPSSTDGIDAPILYKYNCRYILNVLRACEDTKTVHINIGGKTSGLGMKVTRGDSDSESKIGYTFYVMPMSNLR